MPVLSRWLIAGGALLALLAAAILTINLTLAPTSAEPSSLSVPTNSQAPTTVVDGPAVTVPKIILADRLIIPTVDLNVELTEAAVVDGVMEMSDDLTAAFIAQEFGLPIVVALHSSTLSDEEGSIAIGNRLFDRDTQLPLLGTGRSLYVDGVEYETSGWTVMDKDELSQDVVFSGAHSLLLISCAQNADGSPSTRNLVITAIRA